MSERRENHLCTRIVCSSRTLRMEYTYGHYEMPLPLKDDNIKLPDNQKQAFIRLDKKYYLDYSNFVSDIITNGLAERVPKGEMSLSDGRVLFLPHHGVYNRKKIEKVKVFFDCSVVFEVESPNRNLL